MIGAHEAGKYERVWQIPGYLEHSPGAVRLPLFLEIARPGATVLDAGCGDGQASRLLRERGFVTRGLDLVKVCDECHFEQPLWKPIPGGPYEFGLCCDVMEHIPEQFTALAIRNILNVCGSAFFTVSFVPDRFGAVVREPLHLTVRPFTWWRDLFREVGHLLDARDLIGEGVFHAA